MSAAHAQISPQLSQKAPDAATLVAVGEQRGHVRVIVEFDGPVPASALSPDPAFLARVKAQIKVRQDEIIATHFGSASAPREGRDFPRGLMRFDITPMFAVNVGISELEGLAADSRVVRIHYDQPNAPMRP